MWNEASIDVAISAINPDKPERAPKPAVISHVEKNSIGEDLGFEPGDQVISINGTKPRDLIDYKYLIVEENILLEVLDKNGQIHKVSLEKELDDELGIGFSEAIFDGLHQCNNHCPFCFIDQQPPGKRKSLYLKDDDYRLSFLYGSYLTLTNMQKKDWERIKQQRLSPLFVSVHATDPSLRAKMLNNSRATDLLNQLIWFKSNNLQLHAQVVVCPGLNDGNALEKTLRDLAFFGTGEWPAVLSTAVVPVGLTRFRPDNDGLKPINKSCAQEIISQVENLQQEFRSSLGTRFAWLSDEWYLMAEEPLPDTESYEDFPQQENGVGSIRGFLKALYQATAYLPARIKEPRHCSWVVGSLVSNALMPIVENFNSIENLTVHLHGLPSPYWGQEQVATGLLTGRDIIQALRNQELGDQLLIPSMMLREGQPIFLDDMTLTNVEEALDISTRIVDGADDIVAAVLGDCHESL